MLGTVIKGDFAELNATAQKVRQVFVLQVDWSSVRLSFILLYLPVIIT